MSPPSSRPLWRGGVPLAILGASGVAFAGTAAAVVTQSTAGLDHQLFLALRDAADPAVLLGPRWLPETLRDLTGLGSTVVLWILVVAAGIALVVHRRRGDLILLVAAAAGGEGLVNWAKLAFVRARPNLVPDAPQVFTASFPSSHAALSLAVYVTLALLLTEYIRGLRTFLLGLAVALTLAIGTSRVLLGVHWPSDIVGGWCLGAGWAAACFLVRGHRGPGACSRDASSGQAPVPRARGA